MHLLQLLLCLLQLGLRLGQLLLQRLDGLPVLLDLRLQCRLRVRSLLHIVQQRGLLRLQLHDGSLEVALRHIAGRQLVQVKLPRAQPLVGGLQCFVLRTSPTPHHAMVSVVRAR